MSTLLKLKKINLKYQTGKDNISVLKNIDLNIKNKETVSVVGESGYGVETIYAHASKLEVKKSQPVKRGMIIARVGNTGLSTGPHVHYEVRVNGTPVDPLYYVLD